MRLDFRTLRADEIEIRVGSVGEKGATLLLYKDARCDMNLLDEVVGAMNWKREHSRDNANCTVSIYDEEKKEWVSKEDTGKQSFTEAEKGLASDSFKRACVNWGIGRELYSAPFTWISCPTKKKSDGRGYELSNRAQFSGSYVSEISYDESRNIVSLTICNKHGDPIFQYPETGRKQGAKKSQDNSDLVKQIQTIAEQKGITIAHICDVGKVKSIEDMPRSQMEECINWLNAQ